MIIIEQGAPSSTIKAWQQFINSQNCNAGTPDGIWGTNTVNGTKCFQRAAGLTADGLIGPSTYKAAQDRGFSIPPIIPPAGNSNVTVDLSHYNQNLDLAKAKAAGILAVFNKATEGLDPKYNDSSYNPNRTAAKNAGMLWGAYHFGENADGAQQADHFWEIAQPDDQTVLALDYEWLAKNSARNMNISQAAQFVQRIHEKSNRYPVIYTGWGFKTDFYQATSEADKATLLNCKIWPAAYAPSVDVPTGWDAYTFWQYTSHAYVEGLGYCDRNFFNGDEAALRKFWEDNSVAT